jgi:hypothetical protein
LFCEKGKNFFIALGEKMIRTKLQRFRWYGFLTGVFILLVFGCDRYPTNPSLADGQSPVVMIHHVTTEYLPAHATEDGLVADKVNVLVFEIKSSVSARALEFCGRALMQGPPQEQEHVVHFRTDEVIPAIQVPEAEFNVVQTISAGEVFQLIRPKFPTNEFAPFSGSQGMIRSVEITKVWIVDNSGNLIQVSFSQSAS